MNELGHIGSETAKLFVIECVGTRSSENAGAELEENAPGLLGHVELLHKPENETAQKQFPRFCHKTPSDFTEIVNDDLSVTLNQMRPVRIQTAPAQDRRGVDLISDALPFRRLWCTGGD